MQPVKWIATLIALTGCRVAIDEPASYSTKQACKKLDLEVCNAAEGRSDYHFIWEKILSTNCVGSGCHEAGSTDKNAEKIRFDDFDLAYSTIFGVDSRIRTDLKIIEPGNPNASYMLFLMQAVPADQFEPASGLPITDPPEDVGFMPRSNGALCCQKLDAVKEWVTNGALKD